MFCLICNKVSPEIQFLMWSFIKNSIYLFDLVNLKGKCIDKKMRAFIYFFIFCQFARSINGNVLMRDFPLESKLDELEYDLDVIDYDTQDYALATDEIEMNIEKIEEDILSNEFGLSTKKGQQRLSCGKHSL